MNLNNFFIYLILIISLAFNLHALGNDYKVKINSSENIDKEFIISIIDEYLDDLSDENLNLIVKKLSENYDFEEVSVQVDNNFLVINIVENPIINEFIFIGNERFKKEEFLTIIKQKQDYIFYNKKNVNQIINSIKELYTSYGYNKIDISYEMISLENNSVNVKFFFNEYEISKIKKINFIGNLNFNKKSLISQINSKEKSFLSFSSKSNFKLYEVKNDIIRLLLFYQSKGFRNVEIDYIYEFNIEKNYFDISFIINEGKKYYFNKFDLVNNILISDEKFVNETNDFFNFYINNNIKINTPYNRTQLIDFKDNLSEFLFSNGISFFEIKILDKINNEKIDILIEIADVKPEYVKIININGNSRTKDKVIRREIEFAEGDAINDFLISQTTKNLNRLDIFKKVEINKNNKNDNSLEIDVLVEEKTTGDFNIGVSFGTLGGATFVTGLREKNIGGSGRKVEFTINTSDDNTTYVIDVVEPYFANKKLDFLYGVSHKNKDLSTSSSYKYSNFISKLGFRYELFDDFFHNILLKYELKDYIVTDSSTVSSNILNLQGTNAQIAFINSFKYNKLNSFIRPSEGSYTSFKNTISPVTNSTNGFIQNLISYTKYSEYKNYIFSVNSKVGSINSLQNDEINLDNKYSLGGYWLRGFDMFGAGPRNSSTSYVGGNYIGALKLDLIRPIDKNSDNPIDFHIFTDAGKVWDNKNNPTHSKESIRASYGVGIKFYSPIGPVGFSWSFPLIDEDYDIKRMFLFSIGNLN